MAWRSYIDNWKNTFLNKSKFVINQHEEQVAWMRCVAKLAYVFYFIFLLYILNGQLTRMWQIIYRILILNSQITWLMALLLSSVAPGNWFAYCSLTNKCHFYYASIRSLSLGAPFWYVFFFYQWRYLLVSWMQNITSGGSDARLIGTNRRLKRTAYASEITKNTLKTIYHWQYYPI